MPAIEDFVELASAQTREADGNGGGGGGDEGSTGREELASGDHEDSTEATGGNFSGDYDGDESTTQGERCSGGFEQVWAKDISCTSKYCHFTLILLTTHGLYLYWFVSKNCAHDVCDVYLCGQSHRIMSCDHCFQLSSARVLH